MKPEREAEIEVQAGQVWLNDGIPYEVNGKTLNATGWEETHTMSDMVLYTQLEDGKYPAGTQYNREKPDFLSHFTLQPPKAD